MNRLTAASIIVLSLSGCDKIVHQDVGSWNPVTRFHDCTYVTRECGWETDSNGWPSYECHDVTRYGEQWADLETRMRVVYWQSEKKTLESDIKVIKLFEPCHAHGKSKSYPPKGKKT